MLRRLQSAVWLTPLIAAASILSTVHGAPVKIHWEGALRSVQVDGSAPRFADKASNHQGFDVLDLEPGEVHYLLADIGGGVHIKRLAVAGDQGRDTVATIDEPVQQWPLYRPWPHWLTIYLLVGWTGLLFAIIDARLQGFSLLRATKWGVLALCAPPMVVVYLRRTRLHQR